MACLFFFAKSDFVGTWSQLLVKTFLANLIGPNFQLKFNDRQCGNLPNERRKKGGMWCSFEKEQNENEE